MLRNDDDGRAAARRDPQRHPPGQGRPDRVTSARTDHEKIGLARTLEQRVRHPAGESMRVDLGIRCDVMQPALRIEQPRVAWVVIPEYAAPDHDDLDAASVVGGAHRHPVQRHQRGLTAVEP